MTRYLLGVDVGTQGTKGLLCDRNGRVVAAAYREHELGSFRAGRMGRGEAEGGHRAEHDADAVWWQGFSQITRRLLDTSHVDPRAIAAVGLSAFVPAMLPLDEEGRPLRPAILYHDRRAGASCEAIRTRMEEAGLEEAETGPFDPSSPICQLMWMRSHEPQTFARTATVLNCVGYLVFRLTGRKTVDHAMKRSYAPLYDPDRDGWSAARARLLGISIDLLPDRVGAANEVAGVVGPEAAHATGLAAGTPVTFGTADAFTELVAAGAVEAGTAALLYGSFTALLIIHERPVARWHGFHCLPGLYFSGAGVPTGAVLARWFRDEFAPADRLRQAHGAQDVYQLLDDEAAAVSPGCNGLLALPDFSGTASSIHPTTSSGALVGLTLRHGRAHIYRALLEGVAFELRRQLEITGERPAKATAVGGAARSHLWTQIVSDVLTIRQEVLSVPYTAPLGNAYLAGMAVGLFSDTIALHSQWIDIDHTVVPNPALRAVYDDAFDTYCALHELLAEP